MDRMKALYNLRAVCKVIYWTFAVTIHCYAIKNWFDAYFWLECYGPRQSRVVSWFNVNETMLWSHKIGTKITSNVLSTINAPIKALTMFRTKKNKELCEPTETKKSEREMKKKIISNKSLC